MTVSIIEKYVVYGASFNPPHMGHFSAISQMLESYDKVIVFPYPMKRINGVVEPLPPIKQRFRMLQYFFAEHFPQMHDRLILNDLAEEITKENALDNKPTDIIHTYDYLQFIKKKVPTNVHLSVCLGFDAQLLMKKDEFYKEKEIHEEFGVFRLEEESNIKSAELRKFFSDHKNIKSAKAEQYIRSVVGDALATYIFENNLYGIKKNKPKSSTKSIKLK